MSYGKRSRSNGVKSTGREGEVGVEKVQRGGFEKEGFLEYLSASHPCGRREIKKYVNGVIMVRLMVSEITDNDFVMH